MLKEIEICVGKREKKDLGQSQRKEGEIDWWKILFYLILI